MYPPPPTPDPLAPAQSSRRLHICTHLMNNNKEIIEPYAAQHAEHLLLGTTWNEAAKRASQKCKPHAITTSKMVVPHPEQVQSLLQ